MAASDDEDRKPKVLAIASGGGHWTQLLRLRPALAEFDVTFTSTMRSHADLVPDAPYYTVPDASRWQKLRAAYSAAAVLVVLVRTRPDVVVSTGALPGYFALLFGKFVFRSRTIWVDSIANADEMSAAGRYAGRVADVWLTQWEHLAGDGGPRYAGSVLG